MIFINMNLEEYIRPYNKLLNIILQKKFKWFEKIELDDLKYGGVRGQKNFINPVGKMYVNSTWAYKQWREYHYYTPFPYGEELSFGEIIGGDLSKEIQEQFKLCFSVVSGEITPKYMSFSWLTIMLVDKEEDTMKESIRRIVREETEPNKVNLVKKMIHKLYNNVSFIKQSTFNDKPHLMIYFDSDDTAANIESWFDEKIYRDIIELTSGNIIACPDWVANWDSRKKEADVYINTELLRYDNLGNVINESSKSIRRILREEMEFSFGFRRRIETFKAIVWNNFATDYPCDYDNFSHFMRGVRQEIIDVIFEGENDGEPISNWLTLKEAEDYIEKYMIDDLKELYVSRCLE